MWGAEIITAYSHCDPKMNAHQVSFLTHSFVTSHKARVSFLRLPQMASGGHFLFMNSHRWATVEPKPSKSHCLRWISSPMASAKQHRTSTDCSDDGWVGGVDCGSYWTGWLPHLTDQSNKQNVPTAVPKIRQVRLCAMEALPVCRPAGRRLNFKLHNFLRWCLKGQQLPRVSRTWLCSPWCAYVKSHTVNYSRVPLDALSSLPLEIFLVSVSSQPR